MIEKYGKSHLKYCILVMSNIKAMAYSFSKRGNVSQVMRKKWYGVSYNTIWPWMCYVDKNGLELGIFLLLSPKWEITDTCHHCCSYEVLGTEPRASYMLIKCSIKLPTSSDLSIYFQNQNFFLNSIFVIFHLTYAW